MDKRERRVDGVSHGEDVDDEAKEEGDRISDVFGYGNVDGRPVAGGVSGDGWDRSFSGAIFGGWRAVVSEFGEDEVFLVIGVVGMMIFGLRRQFTGWMVGRGHG